MAKTKSNKKSPSVMEGVGVTATAVKLEVMELVKAAMRKLEHGLAYLEKELHNLRANQLDATNSEKKVSSKRPSKRTAIKKKAGKTNRSKNK